MRLRYEGPGHLLAAFGKTVRRGDIVTFAEHEARTLLANRRLCFSIDPIEAANSREEAERPSAHGSRRQWAAYAAKRGIEVSTDMNRDDIVAAFDAPPSGEGEPEAQVGEGHHTTEEQESQ